MDIHLSTSAQSIAITILLVVMVLFDYAIGVGNAGILLDLLIVSELVLAVYIESRMYAHRHPPPPPPKYEDWR